MRGKLRFHEMEIIYKNYCKFVMPYVHNEVEKIKNENVKEMIYNFVIDKILQKKGIRAYMFKKMSDITHINEKEKVYAICGAIELQIAQTYSFNVGADGKSGYGENKRVAFETAKYIKEIHRNYVENIAKVIGDENNKLWMIFEEIYNTFYKAQVIDTLINLYRNLGKDIGRILEKYLDSDEEKFYYDKGIEKRYLLAVYEKFNQEIYDLSNLYEWVLIRTYGINAHLIERFSEMLKVIDKNLSEEKIKALSLYGRYYGIAMQITNDIQDFALDLLKTNSATREKRKDDVFNDILNNKITWPILFALKSKDEKIQKLIYRAYHKPNNIEVVNYLRKELIEKNYIKRAVLEAAAFAHLAIKELDIFKDTPSKYALIDTAISMALFTKYHKLLKKYYKASIRPPKSFLRKRIKEISTMIEKYKSKVFNV